MEHLALEGLWLLAALGAAVLIGIFVAQYVKDLVTGVPSALRTALSQTEATALAAMKEAHTTIVANVAAAVASASTAPPAPVVVLSVGASGASGASGVIGASGASGVPAHM